MLALLYIGIAHWHLPQAVAGLMHHPESMLRDTYTHLDVMWTGHSGTKRRNGLVIKSTDKWSSREVD